MKKTYSELIEYYENVSPREIIADMYFDYKEEIDNLNNLGKQLVEENEQLKEQLQQKENIIKEVREYITGYESISVIQSLNNIENNRGLDEKTMIEMNRRYLIVHDKVLEILDKMDKENI